ncbi:MAG TPA: hypothetical protein VFQ13_11650 [Anaerolineales bacterium]|nr:hypothetical protein [Anaerolineales bacterium]
MTSSNWSWNAYRKLPIMHVHILVVHVCWLQFLHLILLIGFDVSGIGVDRVSWITKAWQEQVKET